MWFLYSLFFAIWVAIYTLLVKRWTEKIDPKSLLLILLLFSLPFLFILLLLTSRIPHVSFNFYILMFLSALLDIVAFNAQFKAIKISEISFIAPLVSFTPIFTTFIAIFTLGEIPTLFKSLGIILIVGGAYLLNISDLKKGIFVPFKKLASDPGARLVMLSTFLWALTPILQKKAILETSPQTPLYASFVGFCFITVMLVPFALKKVLTYKKEVFSGIKLFILFGIGTSLSQLTAYTAFTLANIGYVTTVMKLSGLITIILGGIFLREKHIKERIFAMIIMILGIFALTI